MKSEVMTTEGHIKNVIKETFKVIQEVYENQQEIMGKPKSCRRKSRLIFPKKSKDETRISEQELRFIFVEQLNNEINTGWDVYYSVETPTRDIYRFSDQENPLNGNEIEKINKEFKMNIEGQSANFDLVIHNDKFERIALIEFKANNATEHEHKKDLKKLTNPKECSNIPTYFIEILKGADKGTFKSLHDKIENRGKVDFRCWALERRGNHDITSEIIKYPNK